MRSRSYVMLSRSYEMRPYMYLVTSRSNLVATRSFPVTTRSHLLTTRSYLLKSSLRKFYCRYGDLTKQFEVPLSRMLHIILEDNHIQWHPPLMRHNTNFWPFTDLEPNYRIWLFTRLYEVSIEHLQRVRHTNRGLLLLRTPGHVPLWDLHVF